MSSVRRLLDAVHADDPALQLLLAVLLGAAGVYCLLPRPRGRRIAVGVFLSTAGAVVLGAFLLLSFAGPGGTTVGERVYAGLFWLFASVAVSFAVVMVAQRNPARGAMAFAVSVLATCGLFLLLAAPFLMAATVTVYAGAIIVTFLFVLMLSQAGGPSDENDRSREPLLGSLAGVGFAGLVLFTLLLGSPNRATAVLPAEPVTASEKAVLRQAAIDLRQPRETGGPNDTPAVRAALTRLGDVVGLQPGDATSATPGSLQSRQRMAADPRVAGIVAEADKLRAERALMVATLDAVRGNPGGALALDNAVGLDAMADRATLLAGRADLPARNVAAVGFSLYSEHLLAVELAGTLLLVATVGAVAVAGRRPS